MVYLFEPVGTTRKQHTESSLFLGTFLGQEDSLDVGQNTTLGNGHTSQQLVQFFVIPDSQLEVPWDDARLLVVPGGVTSQLQDLGSQVLHDSRHVDWSAGSNSLRIVAFPEQSVDPAHWELKTCPTGAGLGLSLDLAAFSTSRHRSKRM